MFRSSAAVSRRGVPPAAGSTTSSDWFFTWPSTGHEASRSRPSGEGHAAPQERPSIPGIVVTVPVPTSTAASERLSQLRVPGPT